MGDLLMIISFIIGVFIIVMGDYFDNKKLEPMKIALIFFSYAIICFLVQLGTTSLSGYARTSDYEIWSGEITGVYHKEEWDEWHPPQTYTTTETVNGKTVTRTHTKPGYWEHHNAINRITTTDNGTESVGYGYSPNTGERVKFNDSYPNTEAELALYYPIGTPSASFHSYKNLLKLDKSLYSYDEINLEDYPNLPEYPKKRSNDASLREISVDRVIGDFKNKEELIIKVNEINTYLNSKAVNKQVNVMLVNLGADATKESGFALEQYWEGGNKNDFIITMSISDSGVINWCHIITWSESFALINKLELGLEGVNVYDGSFKQKLEEVKTDVQELYVRMEMAEYEEYIEVETTDLSGFFTGVLFIIIAVIGFFVFGMIDYDNGFTVRYRGRRRRRFGNYNRYTRW